MGYVLVKDPGGDQQAHEMVHARGLAEDMKAAGMNCISLLGPLVFNSRQITDKTISLVAELKKDGKLRVFFATNTFMDWGRSMKPYAWVGQDGKEIEGDYFCMVRSREVRVPELKMVLQEGIDAGFDGVELDFCDWGIDNAKVCFDEKCIHAFNKFNGSDYDRPSLAAAINANEGGILEKWLAWKASIRRDITKELCDYAHQYAKSKGRIFSLRLCQGGVGTELRFTGRDNFLDMIGPMTYGSVAAKTIGSYDEINRIYRQDRGELEKYANSPALIAFLNAGWTDPPPYKATSEEMHALALAAMQGGADGWMFFPEKVTGEEWWSLKRTVVESKIIYAEQFEKAGKSQEFTNLIAAANSAMKEGKYSAANVAADRAIKTLIAGKRE